MSQRLRCYSISLFLLIVNNLLGQLSADFEFSYVSQCPPGLISIVNTSKGNTTCEWFFGNGNNSQNSNDTLSQAYTNAGEYTIKLVVSDGVIKDSITKDILIYKEPIANFTVGFKQGCVPMTVNFTPSVREGDAEIVEHNWDLRNGIVLQETNPTVTYNNLGEFDVFLSVTDGNGCTSFIDKVGFIKTFVQPSVSFKADPSVSCLVPAIVNFTNTSESELGLDYTWDFGNGKFSDKINDFSIYDTLGLYTVKLIGQNNFGCIDSSNKTIAFEDVIESKFDIYNDIDSLINDGDTVCSGSFTFVNKTNPSNRSYWQIDNRNYGRGVSLNKEFNKTGWVTIKLLPVDTSSCIDTIEKKIYIIAIKADFEFSDITCKFPLTVNFNNLSEGADAYKWHLAQNNSSIEKDPVIVISDIYSKGDYTDKWPVYSYTNTLKVENIHGCMDSVSKDIEFEHPDPDLFARKVDGCVPLSIIFDGTSGTDSLLNKYWIFEDTIYANINIDTMEFIYTNGGDYLPMLIVENNMHCIGSDSTIIAAGDYLNPDFSVSPQKACYNDTLSFIDATPNQDLIDYWSYTSTANLFSVCEEEPNPKLPITAREPGWYEVKLTVDYNGCLSSTIKHNLFYVSGPVGSFVTDLDCEDPNKIFFNGSMQQATSFEWDFGDGTTNSTEINLPHNFVTPGDYHVTLKTTNDTALCSHTFEDTIAVRNIVAGFNVDTIICVGSGSTFDASLSSDVVNDCYVEGYLWNFGDSTAPKRTYLDNISKIYAERGKYDVSLIASDINGCSDTATKSIQVFQPEASFEVDTNNGCTPGLSVNFKNTSNDSTITYFNWIFGDGFSDSNIDSVNHVYNSPFEYFFTPRLITHDSHGCDNSYTRRIDIYKPSAQFSATDKSLCVGDTILLESVYLDPDSSYWQIGDGSFEPQDSSHIFNETGVYSVTHKVFIGSCTDSITKTDYISVQRAVAEMIASDTITVCYPQTITFTNIDSSDQTYAGGWDFDFKDYISVGYIKNASISYSFPGVFYPKLEITTPNGCKATDSLKILVQGPYAEFEISDDHPCKAQIIDFEMTHIKDVVEQYWDFGDGGKSIEKNPEYSYSYVDTIIASLVVKDTNGCAAQFYYDTVFVENVIADFLFPDNDTLFCVKEPISTINNSIGGENYVWKINNEVYTDNFEISDLSINNAEKFEITLEISDNNNCTDTANRVIRVFDLPSIDVSTNKNSICVGIEVAELRAATGSSNQISWMPEIFVDDTDSTYTIVNPEYSTLFLATVLDTIGCAQSDTVSIFVHQEPVISRFPVGDTTILLGEKVLLALGTNNPSVISGDFLNNGSHKYFDSLLVQPLESTTFYANVTDVCFENEIAYNVFVREIYTVELPDVFTPNGDGVNDRIFVKGGGIKDLIEFKVYNRYGNLVYHSDDLLEGWDGRYNGKLQNADVYTYFVKVLTFEEEEVSVKGSFNLVH